MCWACNPSCGKCKKGQARKQAAPAFARPADGSIKLPPPPPPAGLAQAQGPAAKTPH